MDLCNLTIRPHAVIKSLGVKLDHEMLLVRITKNQASWNIPASRLVTLHGSALWAAECNYVVCQW